MLHVDISSPSDTTQALMGVLAEDPYVTSVSLATGVMDRPVGDAIAFDVPRESSQEVLDRIFATGVHRTGTVRVEQVETWASRSAFDAMIAAPGAGADAIVWPEVAQRAYTDSELTWTYLAFMIMATLIAGIAIPIDSQILVIGHGVHLLAGPVVVHRRAHRGRGRRPLADLGEDRWPRRRLHLGHDHPRRRQRRPRPRARRLARDARQRHAAGPQHRRHGPRRLGHPRLPGHRRRPLDALRGPSPAPPGRRPPTGLRTGPQHRA
jgi:hypothetical protein